MPYAQLILMAKSSILDMQYTHLAIYLIPNLKNHAMNDHAHDEGITLCLIQVGIAFSRFNNFELFSIYLWELINP